MKQCMTEEKLNELVAEGSMGGLVICRKQIDPLLKRLLLYEFFKNYHLPICPNCFAKLENGHRPRCRVADNNRYIDDYRREVALRIEYGA